MTVKELKGLSNHLWSEVELRFTSDDAYGEVGFIEATDKALEVYAFDDSEDDRCLTYKDLKAMIDCSSDDMEVIVYTMDGQERHATDFDNGLFIC